MKKLVSALAATTFVLGLTLTASAGRSIECEVLAAKEDTVILDCGKQAKKMEVGSMVKIKKNKPPEGC